jgi:ribonuclease BN (tRNA processing enzyme)
MDVLGVCAAYPAQNDACSGYLVSEGGTRVLLDCGPGVMGNLPSVCSYFDLNGVVISHLHVDHYLDIFPLRYALTYSLHRPDHFARVPLMLPPGEHNRLFAGAAAQDREKFEQTFLPMGMSERMESPFGTLIFRFALMSHPIQSFACRVTGNDGASLVYSSDTGFSDALIQFAQGADLLLCEATLQDRHAERTVSGHMTAREAGLIAKEAGVKKLMLTHIWPEYDRSVSVEEAAQSYSGPILLAETGKSIVISRQEASQ